DFPLEAANFLVEIERRRIHTYADVEGGRTSYRVSAKIEPAVETVDHVHQTHGIDVENSRRIGIVPHLGRITRDDDQVPDADRERSEQVRLHAEEIAVAARVMNDRLDPYLALHDVGERLRRHPGAGPGPVGDVDRIDS